MSLDVHSRLYLQPEKHGYPVVSQICIFIWWIHNRCPIVALCNNFSVKPIFWWEGILFLGVAVGAMQQQGCTVPMLLLTLVQLIVLGPMSSFYLSASLHSSSSWSGFIRCTPLQVILLCLSPDFQNTAFHHFVTCFPFPLVGALWLGRSGWHLLTPLSSTMTWHCDYLPPSGLWMWLRLPIVLMCTSAQLA